MAVIVTGMDMPDGCAKCRFFKKHMFGCGIDYSYSCILGAKEFPMPWIRQIEERASDCPIKPLEQQNELFKMGLLKDCESCKAEFRRHLEQQAINGVFEGVEPCEDSVSRELVRKEFCNWVMCKKIPNAFLYTLGSLPPVQPMRKRGKWVEYENGKGIECSECCVRWDFSENMTESFEFCPNCGSDNREVGE